MTSDRDQKQRLTQHFDLGFRELQLRDLLRSDQAGIRMGTFIQAAAFIDALALAYSAEKRVPEKEKGKWRRFVQAYLPAESGAIADAYGDFRSLLLHNFSASDRFGFTHGEPDRHMAEENGRVILDRGSFVAAIAAAFESFAEDVLTDDALGAPILKWLDEHPPIAFWVPPDTGSTARGGGIRADAGRLSSAAASGTGYGTSTTASTVQLGLKRSADRPPASPKMAPSVKRRPKK